MSPPHILGLNVDMNSVRFTITLYYTIYLALKRNPYVGTPWSCYNVTSYNVQLEIVCYNVTSYHVQLEVVCYNVKSYNVQLEIVCYNVTRYNVQLKK